MLSKSREIRISVLNKLLGIFGLPLQNPKSRFQSSSNVICVPGNPQMKLQLAAKYTHMLLVDLYLVDGRLHYYV